MEAPRGMLIHHYRTDGNGIVSKVNIIVATAHNYPAIDISVKKAAECLIQKGKVVTEGLLNMVEMAFRAYDPCLACATHALPGNMPLEVTIRDSKGEIVQSVARI